tara:strand:- start:310 stop:507 length:198 start_codon:yes stop_codon:yes gene_type:complete
MQQKQDLMIEDIYDLTNAARFEEEAKAYLGRLNNAGIKVKENGQGEISHPARTIDVTLHIPKERN